MSLFYGRPIEEEYRLGMEINERRRGGPPKQKRKCTSVAGRLPERPWWATGDKRGENGDRWRHLFPPLAPKRNFFFFGWGVVPFTIRADPSERKIHQAGSRVDAKQPTGWGMAAAKNSSECHQQPTILPRRRLWPDPNTSKSFPSAQVWPDCN